jgi:toxin YoeB
VPDGAQARHSLLKNCAARLGLTRPPSWRPARSIQRDAVFHREFREDLRYWVATDRRVALRTLDLVEAILCDPFRGIGKPEPLKHLGAGVWSRRLTQEHRLVYLVSDDRIDFLQTRYHY